LSIELTIKNSQIKFKVYRGGEIYEYVGHGYMNMIYAIYWLNGQNMKMHLNPIPSHWITFLFGSEICSAEKDKKQQ
jgi:hypothetical protein